MKRSTLVLFRPGTLGDQIVLHASLSSFDLTQLDLILIERFSVCSANREFFNKFAFVYTYDNFFSLIFLCLRLSLRFDRPYFLSLTHSKKSFLRVVADWLFFNIFFNYPFSGMLCFLKFRWRRHRCVSEYKRIVEIINTSKFSVYALACHPTNPLADIEPDKPLNIGFAPLSAWPSKNWPLEYSVILIEYFVKDGHNVALIGDAKLRESFENIAILSSKNVTLLVNLKLNVLVDSLKHMDLVISMDTSILHLSALCSLPTIVVMSDVNRQEEWLPPSGNVLVFRKYVPCGGCFSVVCVNKEHLCMSKVLPYDVYNSAYNFLNSSGKPTGYVSKRIRETLN